MYVRTSYASSKRGFTLIEILVVIGMLAILSTIVLVAINPLRQFAQARNTERQSDVTAVLNAVNERMADNGGLFVNPNFPDGCTTPIPSSVETIGNAHPDDLDLRNCLVPAYISEIPHDPQLGANTCNSATCMGTGEHYYTNYTITQDQATSRITVCSPGSQEPSILGSNPFCLTR